jgi:hypothetical protein
MSVVDIQKQHLLDPRQWISCGENLLAAASMFESQLREYWGKTTTERKSREKFLRANMMLAAFALENVLKALIVQEHRDELATEFDRKKELPHILKTHDLCRLAERARLRLAEDGTSALLQRLTRYSVWAGRYPVPLSPDDLPADDFFNLGPHFVPLTGFVSGDWKNAQILFRLGVQIMEQRKHVPTKPPSATSEPAPGACSEAAQG